MLPEVPQKPSQVRDVFHLVDEYVLEVEEEEVKEFRDPKE